MKIKDARDHTPNPQFGMENLWANTIKGRRGAVAFPVGEDNKKKTKAKVNQGRWIAECPFCNGAELVRPDDPKFYCLSCGNAEIGNKWIAVEFPGDHDKITKELEKRPKEQVANWVPGEKLEDLEKETAEKTK